MAVTFTVTLQGTPLRRTYVSHFDFFVCHKPCFS